MNRVIQDTENLQGVCLKMNTFTLAPARGHASCVNYQTRVTVKHTEENYPPVTSAMDFKSSTETNDGNSVQLKGAPKLKNYRNVTEYNDTKAHETSIETPLRVLKEEDLRHRSEGKIM